MTRNPVRTRGTKCEEDGIKFDSLPELRHYRDLKIRRAAGEIVEIQRPAPRFHIDINGWRCGWYTPDFIVTRADGTMEMHEVKGGRYERDFPLRWKVIQAMFEGQFTFVFVGPKEPKRAKVKPPKK